MDGWMWGPEASLHPLLVGGKDQEGCLLRAENPDLPELVFRTFPSLGGGGRRPFREHGGQVRRASPQAWR